MLPIWKAVLPRVVQILLSQLPEYSLDNLPCVSMGYPSLCSVCGCDGIYAYKISYVDTS